MSKKHLLVIIGLVILSGIFSSCSVNNTTGLITVYNLTNAPIHNIYIGENVIVYTLNPGAKYDYWIYSALEGKVRADEVDRVLAKFLVEDKVNESSYVINKDNPVCIFQVNYEYHLDIVRVDGDIRLHVNPGIQPNENTAYDYPAK